MPVAAREGARVKTPHRLVAEFFDLVEAKQYRDWLGASSHMISAGVGLPWAVWETVEQPYTVFEHLECGHA